MDPLPISQRFIIVTGKGGVGKTTLSAALALCFARRGQRTLLATTASQEKHLSKVLGAAVGPRNSPVGPSLEAVGIQPMEAIQEYALMVLKIRYLQYLLIGTKPMQSFIGSIPGIAEWAIMGKATYHLLERNASSWRYDRVVLDAPATGHSLPLIKIPFHLAKVIRSGPLHAVINERLGLLADPATTGILLVSLPEEMAVSEALVMAAQVRKDLPIPIIAALMNRASPPLFTPEEEERVMARARRSDPSPAIRAAAFRILRERIQGRQVRRLAEHLPVVTVPSLDRWRLGPRDVEELSRRLEEQFLF